MMFMVISRKHEGVRYQDSVKFYSYHCRFVVVVVVLGFVFSRLYFSVIFDASVTFLRFR